MSVGTSETPPETPRGAHPYDVLRIDDIRTGVHSLATSDKLDKESALQVTRLFHAMEMLIRHEITHRDDIVASLRSQLEQQRLRTELDRIATRQIHEEAVVTTPRPSKKFRL